MNFDFDEVAKRDGTNSIKYSTPGVLPMWVADMDFKTPDFILDPLKERINKGCFGYSNDSNEFYDAVISFWKRRHDLDIKREEIIFNIGIIPALSSVIKVLTKEEDNILVLSPVYNMFFDVIKHNNRNVITSNLVRVDNHFEIDFVDLEEKIKKSNLFIFCNPHNPTGNLWNKEELDKVIKLCIKYNVVVISDEIHADITTPGKKYTPILSIDGAKDIAIMASSASKSFNLAGLQGAFFVVGNVRLHNIVNKAINNDCLNHANSLVLDGMINAFNKGDMWLDEMNQYVHQNKLYVKEYIEKELPEISYIEGDGTYLVWLDLTKVTNNIKKFTYKLKSKFNLWVSSGDSFGDNGEGFIRMNLATSRENVKLGMERLKEAIRN